MSELKRNHRVSVWYPDTESTNLANEKIVAFFVGDAHDEVRIGIGFRALAWYFETPDRADSFADLARSELKRFSQFTITQP